MAKFRFVSSAGVDLGVFEGETEAEALDAMAQDAGYESQADAEEVVGAWDGVAVRLDDEDA